MTVQEHAQGVRRLVHDFNNLLFVIGGHCELLNLHCQGSPQARADLAVVAEAVSRASELTAELRELAVAMVAAEATPTEATPTAAEPHVATR